MAASNYTLGKLAVLKIAPVLEDTENTFPALTDLMHFCLTNEITLGIDGTETTFENFCSGGASVKIPTGDEASLAVGEAQWVLNDETLLVLENAKRNHTEVWYVYYPAGESAGAGYWGRFNVKKWEVKSASAGLTVANHDLNPVGLPDRFGFRGDSAIVPGEVNSITPAVLTSGTAISNIGGTITSSRTYSIVVPTDGDLTVATSGGTGNADVDVYNVADPATILGTSSTVGNAETINLTNLTAGTYVVKLKGTAAYSGVSLTATVTV